MVLLVVLFYEQVIEDSGFCVLLVLSLLELELFLLSVSLKFYSKLGVLRQKKQKGNSVIMKCFHDILHSLNLFAYITHLFLVLEFLF